jgi:hypothetical protein
MNNVIAIKSEATASASTIEYGALVWELNTTPYNDGVEYKTTMPGVGRFRIYQYPLKDENSSSAGRWLWSVNFDQLADSNSPPSVLRMEASRIVDTREEAMLDCLNARGAFINDMQQLLARLCPGDAYANGFRAGQDALKQQIIEVLG